MPKPITSSANEIKRIIPWLLRQIEHFEYMTQSSDYSDEQKAIFIKTAENTKRQVELYREIIRISDEYI